LALLERGPHGVVDGKHRTTWCHQWQAVVSENLENLLNGSVLHNIGHAGYGGEEQCHELDGKGLK